MSQTRDVILRTAIDLGFDPDELARTPTYEIEAKLRELKQSDTHAPVPNIIDTPNDDPNFARLQWLIDNEKIMIHAIESNSEAIKSPDFEPDDIAILQREIDSAKTFLKLIQDEMVKLNHWFTVQRAQKLEFYKATAPKLVDVTGQASKHFRDKMSRIDHQVKQVRA